MPRALIIVLLHTSGLFLNSFEMSYLILKFGLLPNLLPYFLSLASATSCYYPDGSVETSGEFEPCVSTIGTVSMCCATNRAQFADECLPSGLCWNPCATSGFCGTSTGGQYWRESCTDASWTSPFCLKSVCTNPTVSNTKQKRGNYVKWSNRN
jgi:hypothetical protein